MNGFFRTAAFPLIVVILLVYLASQTLLGSGGSTTKLAYSEFASRVESDPSVRKVIFRPNLRKVRAELVNSDALESSYPSPESQRQLERRLQARGVPFDFDWKRPGTAPWWSILTALLPFVLLMAFWVFLIGRSPRQVRRPRGLRRARSADLHR